MPKYRGYAFGLQPASKLAKTIMTQPNTHSTTMEFGRVVPIKCAKINPGDIISEKVAALIRMSTPYAPIMSGLHGSLHAFFVPMRLVWVHTKEFYGENTASAGPQLVDYNIPHTVINGSTDATTVGVGSVAHYLGYPLRKRAKASSRNDRTLNVLPIRGYYEIINNYYRAQQVMDPWLVDYGDTGAIGTRGGVAINVSDPCAKALKNFDLFTTSLISPTYGGETSLPLLGYAPLGVIQWPYKPNYVTGTGARDLYFGKYVGASDTDYYALKQTAIGTLVRETIIDSGVSEKLTAGSSGNFTTNLIADLSQASATKLNDLYLAMAVEKWRYHANFGTRYFERLEVSYGVRNPDLVLDRPEHLGEFHFDINIQTVISTADTVASGTGAPVGQPGANSATAIKCNLFNHSFGEYGYLYILMNTYVDQIYSAGADRFLTDKDILDIYWPEFVNKGDEGVLLDNLYFDEGQDNSKAIFGFQEAWCFERFQKSRASGLLDPYVDTSVNSSQTGLKGFIVGQKFSTAPSLDETFLTEDRTPLTEALVSGVNGPDFVCDFLFDEKITRSITPRSEPGIPSRLW